MSNDDFYSVDIVYEGKLRNIALVSYNDKCEVKNFLEKLKKDNIREYKKIFNLMIKFADSIKIFYKEEIRHERDKIYALKKGQVRIYGFFREDSNTLFICCNAIIKKTQKNTKAIENKIDKCIMIRSKI